MREFLEILAFLAISGILSAGVVLCLHVACGDNPLKHASCKPQWWAIPVGLCFLAGLIEFMAWAVEASLNH
jgi:hypothetical protein